MQGIHGADAGVDPFLFSASENRFEIVEDRSAGEKALVKTDLSRLPVKERLR
jgi:hypothetical protein